MAVDERRLTFFLPVAWWWWLLLLAGACGWWQLTHGGRSRRTVLRGRFFGMWCELLLLFVSCHWFCLPSVNHICWRLRARPYQEVGNGRGSRKESFSGYGPASPDNGRYCFLSLANGGWRVKSDMSARLTISQPTTCSARSLFVRQRQPVRSSKVVALWSDPALHICFFCF